MLATNDNALGTYLTDRRAKLDPAAFGFPLTRRRTPGLRREEVAQRANVSATWYTWLEQGRGGAPSADVLDRIARALVLTDVEREHLFLLGLGRPPEVSGRMRRAPGPRPKSQPSWTNSAGSVPSSRRCGATTTSAATAAASNICGIRSPDRSLSNTRPSRSTAGPISAWWSIIPRLRQTPSGSDRSSGCRPGKLLA